MAKRRTQIYLTDEEVRVLQRESKRSGKSMAALIREAIDSAFGLTEARRRRRWKEALDASFGAWNDVPDQEIEALEQMRHGWSERQREFLDELDEDVP